MSFATSPERTRSRDPRHQRYERQHWALGRAARQLFGSLPQAHGWHQSVRDSVRTGREAALVQTAQKRYEAGAGTLVELAQARATRVQAASAVITARYTLVFQATLMPYYTGELDAEHVTLKQA
jgi:outer membrane protein TolC